jgi:syntaxin 5
MGGQDLLRTFQGTCKRIASDRGPNAPVRTFEPKEPSVFVREAGVIQRALVHLDKRLEKLVALAKKDGIFDDATMEISELTSVLKQDRDRVEKMLEVLASKVGSYHGSEHAQKHAQSIVKSLQMGLGDATQEFTRALEVRAKTMQLQQKKRQAFTGPQMSVSAAAMPVADHVALDMGSAENSSGGGNQYMQQELLDLDPQTQQLRAIQQIEGTLVQLGQMFSQFSVLVQRQGEQIERIDDQVEQTHSNIERAQQELLQFYQNISGNRSLIMKLFGVTAGFVVVFVMFFL